MALAENYWREPAFENKSGRVNFSGFFTTTTSGTLAAAATDAPGFTLTKVGATTGRYTLQLVNSKGEPVVVSPAGPANPKVTPGLLGFKVTILPTAFHGAGKARLCDVRSGLATLASAGNFLIQFHDGAATPADAEVTDGASFIVEFSIKRSSAVP